MNVFEKLKDVREIVRNVYPNLDVEELKVITQFLANKWHGNKRKNVKLTQKQMCVYELLLKNGHNPATVYKWILATSSPKEIRDKLRNNKISLRDALSQKKRLKPGISVDDRKFIDAVVKCIEMYISETGENYPGRSVKWQM